MKTYLNQLKSERNMTNQQIADLSGVSLSTVNRIMSGAAKNPSHEAVTSICTALGGSMDDAPAHQPDSIVDALEQHFAREREHYEAQIRTKDIWIRALAIAFGVLMMFLLAALFIDMFNPNVGWIRE